MPFMMTGALKPQEADLLNRLDAAITATLAGRRQEALAALVGMHLPPARLVSGAPLTQRPSRNMLAGGPPSLTPKDEMAIFQRDGWLCRYCARPTILRPVINLLYTLYSEQLNWSGGWTPKPDFPMHWSHAATVDHVWPQALGGTHAPGNLVTACYACQDAKNDKLSWKPQPVVASSDWGGFQGACAALHDVWISLGPSRPPLLGKATGHRAWRTMPKPI
jgi:hypothetical protein